MRHLVLLLLFTTFAASSLAARDASSSAVRAASYNNIFHNPDVAGDSALAVKCGLPAISYAIEHRDALSPEMKASLTTVLVRPQTQRSIVIGKFRINYDTTGTNEAFMLNAAGQRIPGSANIFADSVGAIANYAATFETNGVLGYDAPFSTDGSPYDIYIEELGSLYGFTTPETALDTKNAGGTFSTSITIDNDFIFVSPDSNKGLPAVRVTLAHEFFHAIQIGKYGYWSSDRYYYEISSVWMEDVVYTDVNDYVQYLRSSQSQFQSPETPFTSGQQIMYSRGIWGLFIEKRFGRDVMRGSWEEIRSARPLEAIDRALSNVGSTLRFAFSEWTLWNFFTGVRSDPAKYYPEGSTYPFVREATRTFAPPSSFVQGMLKPLSAQYYDIVTSQDTLTLALSNIFVNSPNPDTPYGYEYKFSSTKPDDTYKATSSNVFVKLDVPDVSNWQSWDIHKGSVGPVVSTSKAFPNPFHVDGRRPVYIPVNVNAPVSGTLSIFSSSMDLIYTAAEDAVSPQPGTWSFFWNGTTLASGIAASGTYIYVVDFQGRQLTGKISVIRE